MRAAVACLLACSVLVAMARADRHGGDEDEGEEHDDGLRPAQMPMRWASSSRW